MIGVGFAAVQALGTAGKLASGILSAQSRQAEFAEQIRQMQRKRDYTLSLTSALVGASGVEASSVSTTDYLKAMTGEFDRQIDMFKKTAKTSLVSDLLGATFDAVGGGANTYGGLAKLNNFFQDEKKTGYTPGLGMPLWRDQ